MPVDDFVNTMCDYPTLAESYKAAVLDGLNRLNNVQSNPAGRFECVGEREARHCDG